MLESIDWSTFWFSIITGIICFIFCLPISIWLIPKFTLRLIQKRNKSYLTIKLGGLLQELCDFISDMPYKCDELTSEHLGISTKRKDDMMNYRFITLCTINVFKTTVFPKIKLVIYEYYNNKNSQETYDLFTEEYRRLKELRLEIEGIISVHSLHINDKLVQQISDLCFTIRNFETHYKYNKLQNDFLLEGITNERIGVFGLDKLVEVYEHHLITIQKIIQSGCFEYEVSKTEK